MPFAGIRTRIDQLLPIDASGRCTGDSGILSSDLRNVGLGKDHTLFALIDGRVDYRTKAKGRTYVSVVPATEGAPE